MLPLTSPPVLPKPAVAVQDRIHGASGRPHRLRVSSPEHLKELLCSPAVALSQREDLSLEDFRSQLQQLGRMGSLGELLSFLPNTSKLPAGPTEKLLLQFGANLIYYIMT